MTTDKRLKARIRARMAKTGERYTAARRHFVASDAPPRDTLGYALRGGQHPDAAALASVLAHAGVVTSDGEPLSEALVFGVMGGLGAGYILWEFAHDDSRIVVLGFANQWQYLARGARTALDRLGVPHTHHTTGGAKGAAQQLETQLDSGRPGLIWPDRYHIGYWHLPPGLDGQGGPPVVVYGRRGGRVFLDDRNVAPLTVDIATLHRARARVGSYKHALLTPEPAPGPLDPARLTAAIRDGIAECADHLGGTSASFGLPAWRKWARLMTGERNAKAWPVVFADRRALAGALLSVWEGTSQFGVTGGHLRDLYADFLEGAAAHLGTSFDGPITALRESSDLWRKLGDTAVDPERGAMARLRDLTVAVRQSITADGDDGRAEAQAAAAELWELRTTHDRDCPLSADEARDLFGRMGTILQRIFEVETAAVRDLAASLAPR